MSHNIPGLPKNAKVVGISQQAPVSAPVGPKKKELIILFMSKDVKTLQDGVDLIMKMKPHWDKALHTVNEAIKLIRETTGGVGENPYKNADDETICEVILKKVEERKKTILGREREQKEVGRLGGTS